ncbi:hypothetical protein ABZT47_06220 [Sphaerisporangium sp. NPDC005289]|uniref:hypothetical protein n=1 Tax=Sphaerisporangium sp. NPDC005289 TaxID=3155247 RepID=UPI0033A3E918
MMTICETDSRLLNAPFDAAKIAESHSQLVGILAGFAFVGMTMMLGPERFSVRKIRTLALLWAAFVILAMDSFLFGVTSGGKDIPRTWDIFLISCALLGVGAVAVAGGGAWLFGAQTVAKPGRTRKTDGEDARAAQDHALLGKVSRGTVWTTALVVAVFNGATGLAYLNARNALHPWPLSVVVAYPTAIIAAITIELSIRRRRSQRLGADPIPPRLNPAPTFEILSAISYAGAAAIAAGYVINIEPPLSNILALSTFLASIPSIVALIHSTPLPQIARSSATATPPSVAQRTRKQIFPHSEEIFAIGVVFAIATYIIKRRQ